MDVPVGTLQILIVVADFVAILENAADLDGRQGENLGFDCVALAFLDQLVVRLAGERDDGPVGLDGAADDGIDAVAAAAKEWQLDVGEILAAFGQHLQADVIAVHVQGIFCCFLAEKVYRRRIRDLRNGSHGQLGRSWHGELGVQR